ncbi:MAG: protein translocase subunit SecD [Verrucomicrobiota bacterium]
MSTTLLASTSVFGDPLVVFGIGLLLMILFFWYFATDIERRKRNVGTILTIGVCALCLLAATPPKERLKGGIDILGGSSFSLHIQPRVDESGNEMPITPAQVEQAIIVIEKRLNGMGTAEPIIARQGTSGILLQMPGVEPGESQKIRETLEKVAKLELRKVSERSEEPGPNGKTLAERVLNEGELAVGERAYLLKGKDGDGNEYKRAILLSRRSALGGSDIANAVPSQQQGDAVDITLNGDGTDKMIALTKNMRPGQDRIAIVLDGEVISAPVVNQVPLGKHFIIEGLRESGEVQTLANSLMNPLENALVVDEMRNVSPTLGEAVVTQGMIAGGLSLLMTFLFVFVYYRVSGFIANIGLVVNTIILFGVMAMFGFTFTLPGIAGMVLTIGMAVDANVLIYERLREEIASGKSLKHAIEASYDRAFSAIFDSHVTSLITAVILFILGSGTIKGFAITLTIGVTASLFSAILVTRVIFRWGIDLGWFKQLTFLNLIKAHRYDFMGKRHICIAIAAVTFLASLATFGIRREHALGIDFTGGTRIMFQLGKNTKVTPADVDKVYESIRPQLSKEAYPGFESNPTSGTLLTIRCATDNPKTGVKDASLISAKLREAIPELSQKETLIKVEASTTENLTAASIRKALGELKLTVPTGVEESKSNMISIRCALDDPAKGNTDTTQVIEKLKSTFTKSTFTPEAGVHYKIDASQEEVSALIGGSFLTQSLIAIILGFVGIMLYMTARFEFSFALGGFIAIFHDVIICVGIVVMLGGQLSLIHIGAVLTIAGYSISDTIVVFDRIREMLLIRTDSVEKVMNDAINATLSRTLLTSGATLISVLILTILGGTDLRSFGFIIFIGIIIGTFSSIFIASPVALWWSNRRGGNIREVVRASVAKEEALSAAP